MDRKKIEYEVIDDEKTVLEKAKEYKTLSLPFAIIDGKFYDDVKLKEFIEGYNL